MRAQVAAGFLVLVLAAAGVAAPAAGAGAGRAAATTCHGVVYPPYEVSDPSQATEVAFSARQVCDGVAWSCANLGPGRFRTEARYEIFFPTGDVSKGRHNSDGKDLC